MTMFFSEWDTGGVRYNGKKEALTSSGSREEGLQLGESRTKRAFAGYGKRGKPNRGPLTGN
jgi:hypothetical protein